MVLLSAGLEISEQDFSAFAKKLGLARFVVVGGATRGPVGVPTAVTSPAELRQKFGQKLTTDLGLQAAETFLTKGNNLVYLRVADGTEAKAAVDVPGTSGGTPAVASVGTVSFTGAANPSDGETVTLRDGTDAVAATGTITLTGATQPTSGDTLTIFDNLGTTVIFGFGVGGDVTVAIGATAAITLSNLIIAINASALQVNAVDTTTGDPEATVTHGQPGTVGNAATILVAGATPPTVTSPLTGGSDGTAFTFEFDDDAAIGGGNIGVLIGATAAATLVNLITAIASSALEINAVDGTITIPLIDLTHNIPGDAGNQTITETGAAIGVTGMAGGVDLIPGSVTTVMSLEAVDPGSFGNDIDVTFVATAVFGAPADSFDMDVLVPPDLSGAPEIREQYQNLSLDPTSVRFIETVLAEGIIGEVARSEFIRADAITTGSPDAGTVDLGATTPGSDGITGLTFSDFIGTVSGVTSTGLKALRNPDRVLFNILAVPGQTHFAIIDEIKSLAIDRGDFLGLIDPPLGLDVDQIIDWHNGVSTIVPNAPTTPIDSSYLSLWWSHLEVFDDVNKVRLFLPPSGFVAANMAVNDDFVGPWFPVSGHNRGVLEADAVEFSPDKADRNKLAPLVGQNRVNPIVDFVNQGPTLFGNRTLQRKETALVSLHVRRMLLHAEALIANSVKFLIFEPNDPVTWRKFELMVNPILEFIGANQGLEEFRVQADASTTPIELRRQRRMNGKIIIKPLEAAEAIGIDFGLLATGAEFTEVL